MSSSTLDTENSFERDRVLNKGHGTVALGPSDTSDSGSDIAAGGAGFDIGDPNLDSDTDAEGTGERAGVGRDRGDAAGLDIGVDQIVQLDAYGNLQSNESDAEMDEAELDHLPLELPTSDDT